MADPLFVPLADVQRTSHCGPTALASVLFFFGVNTTQDEVVKAARLSRVRVSIYGMDEQELMGVAKKHGIATTEIVETVRSKGKEHLTELRAHLAKGLPALYLIWDFTHWIAVLGELNGHFIIVDPLSKRRVFDVWSEAQMLKEGWNDTGDDDDEPSQYCSLLFERADGRPPQWQPTVEWLALCQGGSYDTAANMASDLQEIVKRATESRFMGGVHVFRPEVEPLGAFIRQNVEMLTQSVMHWGEGAGQRGKELTEFCIDYATIADACSLTIPVTANRYAIIAQLTALLSAWWWGATF